MGEGLIVFSILAFVAFLIWNRTQSGLERRRLELQAHGQILEKIGPGQALSEFLKTDEGKQFFNQVTAPHAEPARRDARWRILVLTTLGLIVLFAGFFFVMGFAIPNLVTVNPTGGSTMLVNFLPVFLLTGAGVGALIAALIMHRLSKKWDMLEPKTRRESAD